MSYRLSLENNAPAVAAAVLALLGGQFELYIASEVVASVAQAGKV